MPTNPDHLRDPGRLADLESFGVLDTPAEADFDRLTRLAAKLLKAPVALVSLVTGGRQFFKSCLGLPEPWATERETPLSHSFCRHVVEASEPLVIEDAREHPLVKDNLAVSEIGVVAYLGIPLVSAAGHVLGSFCVIDTRPRAWTPEDIETLGELATSVMTELELRRKVAEEGSLKRKAEQSEERFRALVTASSDVVYRMSPDWSEMHLLLGREGVADAGEPDRGWMERTIAVEDRGRVRGAIAAAVGGKSVFELEHRARRADGTPGWTHSRAVPILDERGDIIEWFGTACDVTDRKLAEEAIKASEERYRTLFTSIEDGFCVLQMIRDASGRAADFRFLEVNPAFERHTGLGDSAGKRMRELVPDHDAFWFETYGRVAETGEPQRFEYTGDSLEGRSFDLYAFRIGDPSEQKIAVIFNDITDRRRFEAERERHVRQLTEADRRKDEFLAMLAHELRNPLAAISNASKLAEGPGDQEQGEFTRDVIRRQVGTLGRLIDDLLDVSRVSQGKVTLRKTTLELGRVVAAACELAAPLVERRRHALTVSVPGPNLRFEGDKTRVEQILGNILTNAAKYTEPGGHIELSAREVGEEVVFVVRDDGIGISAAMLPEVFGLFTQVDSTIDRSQGGLGIGLTLVRSLVEMHGGRVTAESEGTGKGSAFTVRIPIGRPIPEAPESEKRTPSRKKRRILVVDDNHDIAKVTARLLKISGYEVRVAFDGREAIEMARAFDPEAILLDIGLPGMNGYEVAAALKDLGCCPDATLIALTGYGDGAAVQRTLDAGFRHHMTKPADFAELTELIESSDSEPTPPAP